jgi:hypothetical protein
MSIYQFISPEYCRLMEKTHTESSGWGVGGHEYARDVRMLVKGLHARTVLDYGCGIGTLAKHPLLIRFRVREYDPGISSKADLPHPADLVACTDVLEHVEPDYLDAVMRHLYDLTRIACFAVVATRPAKRFFADGRNAHLIIEPEEWWLDRFRALPWRVQKQRSIENHSVVLLARK